MLPYIATSFTWLHKIYWIAIVWLKSIRLINSPASPYLRPTYHTFYKYQKDASLPISASSVSTHTMIDSGLSQ